MGPTHCYCGSESKFDVCCLPLIKGETFAETAEQLMRSRFSAFCSGHSQYLLDTHHPDFHRGLTVQQLDESCKNTRWVKLDVLDAESVSDVNAKVHFRAWYLEGALLTYLEENSSFVKEGRYWLYTEGEFIPPQSSLCVKIGRNDACPCRSGKKFKKCCAP